MRRSEGVWRRVAIDAEYVDAFTRCGQQRSAAHRAETNNGEFARRHLAALFLPEQPHSPKAGNRPSDKWAAEASETPTFAGLFGVLRKIFGPVLHVTSRLWGRV